MFKRLRNLIIVAILVIAVAAFARTRLTAQSNGGAGAGGAGGGGRGTGAIQDTSIVDKGDIILSVSATGPLQANQTVTLSFPVTGKVTSIAVIEGDHVRKGQTIATIDKLAATDAVTLAQAKVAAQQVVLKTLTDKPRQVDINVLQAAVDLAKATLKSAMSSGPDRLQAQINALNVESAKTQLWSTELVRDANDKKKADLRKDQRTAPQADNLPTDNQNNSGLAQAGYNVDIAQAQYEAETSKSADVGNITSAQAQVTAAQVALDKLLQGGDKDDVARAQAQLQAAQAALDFAKESLDKTTLVAPFDGVVAKLNLHIGEVPSQTVAAVTYLDTSSFYVDVPIDETDIAKIQVGQPVTMTLDALPGTTVNGKVTRVAQTSTKSGDVVTYTAHIEIDPAGQPILSAMSATATIITDQIKGAVRVRNRFIRLDRASNKAFANVRQPDGTFREVPVVLGLRNDTYSEVKSGLASGDVIASVQVQQGFGGPGGRPAN